jgi:outer membrane protein assembly factor BamB
MRLRTNLRSAAAGWGIASILWAATAGPTGAADWPRWRGPEGTGHVPAGETVPARLAAEIKPAWRIDIGSGFGSPVVAGGTVYFMDLQDGKEVARAVEAATGKPLWQTPIDEPFKDGWGTGPRFTPLVDGPRLYVLSCKGEFRCLAAEDGKPVWRKHFVADFGAVFIGEKGSAVGASRHGNTAAPVLDGDHLIVPVGGLKGASLVCFGKATGEVVWQSESDPAAHAALALATFGGTRQVVAFAAEALFAVDARDGKPLWRVPIKTRLGRHITTPVIAGDCVVVSSYQAGLMAVRVSKAGDGFQAAAAWTSKELAINAASPVAAGEYLYGVGPKKEVFCADLQTGAAAWTQTGLIAAPADKAHATFLVMGDRILMLSDAGELILFKADPKAYQELGRAQGCGKTWCNPAYAGGRLYLRDANRLLCIPLADPR